MAQFDHKTWNPEVFEQYSKKVPYEKLNMLLKSGVLERTSATKSKLRKQTGGNYITEPIKGNLDGNVVNYDGKTDITSTSRKTFAQSKVVLGRAKGWVEKDFSTDITGAKFLPVASMAGEVGEFFQSIDNGILLSILKGIFSMTDTAGQEFVNKHTYEVTGDGLAKAGTLNRAITKASGDKSQIYSLAIMHSDIAADLSELQLLEYVPYNDAQGIERALGIAKWNGKTVFVDDETPVSEDGEYTTYVLGRGAIEYDDIGAEVPNEMARDAAKNGGETTLYVRIRKLFAPKYISFTKKNMATDSPTNQELEDGTNWEIVNDGDATSKTYVSHKLIPFVRILSKSAESNVAAGTAQASEQEEE